MLAAHEFVRKEEQHPESTKSRLESTASTPLVGATASKHTNLHISNVGDSDDVWYTDAMDLEAIAQQSDADEEEERTNDKLDDDDEDSRDDTSNHDEDEVDEDTSALKKAARAGIQLLEENAQLADEVQHLQLQLVHTSEHTHELQRVLGDKDTRIDQLMQHLRASISENQRVTAELSQSLEQVAACKMQLAQHQHQAAATSLCSTHRRPSYIGSLTQQQPLSPQRQPDLELDETFVVADSDSGDTDVANNDTLEQQSLTPSAARGDSSELASPRSNAARSPNRSISPKRRQSARLEEIELRFEEAHRRNSQLKLELNSAQKKVRELKPLTAQLHEAREEAQVLLAQVEQLESQLQLIENERFEERALLQSLRATVEIYQCLDTTSHEAGVRDKLHRRCSRVEAVDNDNSEPVRHSLRMRRCNSASHVLPVTMSADIDAGSTCDVSGGGCSPFKSPARRTGAADGCLHAQDEREAAGFESLDVLSEQLLELQLLHLQSQLDSNSLATNAANRIDAMADAATRKPIRASDVDDTTRVARTSDVSSIRREAILEQRVSILQDLLRRYRAQWQQIAHELEASTTERTELLRCIEMQSQLKQRECEQCANRANESIYESEAWCTAARAYETLLQHASGVSDHEDAAEAERVCFSLLHRLVNSWTNDRSKRMQLDDWLTNAIRGTGMRRALALPDLSVELASGFQLLLVPMLHNMFGVDVNVEQQRRNVVVTDLQLRVTQTDAAKAKTCLQRVSRSLLWLMDAKAEQRDDSAWLAEVSRKQITRIHLCK